MALMGLLGVVDTLRGATEGPAPRAAPLGDFLTSKLEDGFNLRGFDARVPVGDGIWLGIECFVGLGLLSCSAARGDSSVGAPCVSGLEGDRMACPRSERMLARGLGALMGVASIVGRGPLYVFVAVRSCASAGVKF